MTRLVLASASPGRLAVLRGAGIDPLVVVSGVDEDAAIASLGDQPTPDDVVRTLATAKANAVLTDLDASVTSDSVVVGCDSMLFVDGRLCGKPQSVTAARAQWQSMAGRTGHLHTGHCVIRLRHRRVAEECRSAVTAVHFGMPPATDLDAYLAGGEPLRVAGGFTIDGLGGWFIDGIDGDPSNVVGLSLPLLRRLFARLGLSVAALWAANPAET